MEERTALPHDSPIEQITSSPFWIGPHGLRAGWGVLLFAFFLGLFGYVLLAVAGYLNHLLQKGGTAHHSAETPIAVMVSEGVELLAVLLATFTAGRLQGRSMRDYGFARVAVAPRLLGGFAWGFVFISALILLLWGTHVAVVDGLALSASQALHYGLLWFVAFLTVGFLEESLLRGYLLFTLMRGIGFWPAAVLLSIAFGAIHLQNGGETPMGLLAAAAISLVFCLSIRYTRSLWWAIGFHATWDWGESFFWGTADSGIAIEGYLLREHPLGNRLWSGGATGPEGSLFIFAVAGLLALGIWLYWRRSPALTA